MGNNGRPPGYGRSGGLAEPLALDGGGGGNNGLPLCGKGGALLDGGNGGTAGGIGGPLLVGGRGGKTRPPTGSGTGTDETLGGKGGPPVDGRPPTGIKVGPLCGRAGAVTVGTSGGTTLGPRCATGRVYGWYIGGTPTYPCCW